jgi:AcrR family transcriptional regulator/RimJ/RimL family protein N-acetyltransferase
MPTDDELRERILDAAEQVFADHGYEGTRVRMVAAAAGVAPHTVRRLTGDRSELFAQVMAARVTSDAAERIAEAVADPGAAPPAAALLDAADEVFTSPGRSWEILELEAMTRAHRDPQLREIESVRVQRRWDNAREVIRQAQRAGGLDPDVDPEAVTHLALALSVGLAMVDPVVRIRPRAEDWGALIARIVEAVSPAEPLLSPDHIPESPWRVRVDVSDVPGGVARLVRALDALHTYTIGLQVVDAEGGYRTVDVALRAPSTVTEDALLATALASGRAAYVTRGPVGAWESWEEPVAALLNGAARLVTNPSLAPSVAATLLEADHVEVTRATEGADDSPNVLRLQWTPDLHVVLQRSWAPFARAERARASALLQLSAAISVVRGEAEALGSVEPIKDGAVWIRLARPDDADEVAAMHDRSSERTRYLRYVTTTQWREAQLHRLAGGHRGATLVAVDVSSRIVGLGNIFPETSDPEGRSAELALIVEDAFQGRGVGTVLMRHEVALARRLGFSEVVAVVLAENTGMLRLLEHSGLDWTSTIDSGVATWRAPLDEGPVRDPDRDRAADPHGSTPRHDPRPQGATGGQLKPSDDT